ncbi:MAG: hypothetical protein RL701_1882 [Pseudomonadota bacterium]
MTTSAPELLLLADQNMAEFFREQARWLPGFQLVERDDVLWVAGGTRFPGGPLNCVLPLTSRGAADPERVIAEARTHFTALDRGFSVHAPAHFGAGLARACIAENLTRIGDTPGMVLEQPVALATRELDGAEVSVRLVDSPLMAADFSEVCAGAYEALGMPAAVTRKVFSLPERWRNPYWHTFVVYERERAVSAAALLFSHGIAGIYWVATSADARSKGYGELVTRHASHHAFKAGARCVILQASPFGEPIYRKLGFREITRYPMFLSTLQA